MNTEQQINFILDEFIKALHLEDVGDVFLAKLDAQRKIEALVGDEREKIEEIGYKDGYNKGYEEGENEAKGN
jgi:flagellar biosynthesis/type III secretory pathway protein FliH